MQVGDLVKHKRCGNLAIVLMVRGQYIDLAWFDNGAQDSAYFDLFEVISESR